MGMAKGNEASVPRVRKGTNGIGLLSMSFDREGERIDGQAPMIITVIEPQDELP